jgi:predicted metal-dependent phosphoesterase TrpH
MRCDLHVHTIHSGMCTVPVLNRVCRESYNNPHEVYETLKRRGMQIVTVTDHDSIDAAESLRRHADFFLSEEVSCRMSSGTELHVGVYGLDERDHIQLQSRRDDFPALLAYLRERGLLFSVNHAFSSLTGRRKKADFLEFAECFPALETRNGQVLRRANVFAARFARRNGLLKLGGSDSHTLKGLGRTFTEVPGARTPEEFLAGLRAGWSRVCGESGNYWKLTADVLDISVSMIRENPWTALLAPLWAAVPLVTLGNLALELAFANQWGGRVARSSRTAAGRAAANAHAGAVG